MENMEQEVANKVEDKVENKIENKEEKKIADNAAVASSEDNNIDNQSEILLGENLEQDDEITLEQVVYQCRAFLAKEINRDQFIEFCNKIIIKPYLPLLTKTELINTILVKLNLLDLGNSALITEDLELYKIFILLLAYSNINVEKHQDLWREDIYDLLMVTIVPAILMTCQEDFNRLNDMLQHAINIDNIINVLYVSSAQFDQTDVTNELKQATEELRKSQTLLNKINISN